MASLNNWDSLSNEPLMPHKNTWSRCIAPQNGLLNTENSMQWATVPDTMIQGRKLVLFSGWGHKPAPEGLLDQVWFFLLTLEAIHPLTDGRGYFCFIRVGGGVWQKKQKKKTSQLFALKQKKKTSIKIPRLNIADTFKWWDFNSSLSKCHRLWFSFWIDLNITASGTYTV